MDRCCLHHVEFGVQNIVKCARQFICQYNFKLVAVRDTSYARQCLLTKERVKFLLTQLISFPLKDIDLDNDPYLCVWFDPSDFSATELRDTSSKVMESAFNISFEVTNIEKLAAKLKEAGVKVIKPLLHQKTAEGEILTVTVQSCMGNIKHTLVQRKCYSGTFLPGFHDVQKSVNDIQWVKDIMTENQTFSKAVIAPISHVDHVTLVSNIGTSNSILSWYERHFGMKRFKINRGDDDEEGFVINGQNIGIRLTAFEYWKCAEVGLTSLEKHQDSIKIVIAEALPGQGPNQLTMFLKEHNGPGVQHIGLYSSDIVSTVAALAKNGVKFAEPPVTYYSQVGRLEEIEMVGEDVDILQKNGILIDLEADSEECPITEMVDANVDILQKNGICIDLEADSEECPTTDRTAKHRYLMQKFTCPLFSQNTFFLEIIQRLGASGFGSGNITALWRSVQAYLAQNKV